MMAKKVLILPLSLIVKTSPLHSVVAFHQLGVGYLKMIWHWSAANHAFNQYKRGLATDAQFLETLRNLHPVLKNIEDDKVWAAWNKMSHVTKNNKAALAELKALESEDIEIIICSSTNPAHVAHINQQLKNKMPGTEYYSYQQKELGAKLLDKLLKEERLIGADIRLCYKNPPVGPYPQHTWMPFLRWLRAPISMWFHQQAVNHVQTLKNNAKNLGYSLLDLGQSDKPPFTELLQKLGWVKKTEHRVMEEAVTTYSASPIRPSQSTSTVDKKKRAKKPELPITSEVEVLGMVAADQTGTRRSARLMNKNPR